MEKYFYSSACSTFLKWTLFEFINLGSVGGGGGDSRDISYDIILRTQRHSWVLLTLQFFSDVNLPVSFLKMYNSYSSSIF